MEKLGHEWSVSPREARMIQERLRSEVCIQGLPREPRTIAGVDVSMNRFGHELFAGIVVSTFPDLEALETSLVKEPTTFPYIPGLLSFREIPALLKAFSLLKTKPDLIMVDGHGIAHPRRLGIASHLGVLLEIPTIGCAKSVLVGSYEEPDALPGSVSPLTHNGDRIGSALRTKERSKPVFVSPGHLTSHEDTVHLTFRTLRGYKLPEPTRRAHLAVNEFRKLQQKV